MYKRVCYWTLKILLMRTFLSHTLNIQVLRVNINIQKWNHITHMWTKVLRVDCIKNDVGKMINVQCKTGHFNIYVFYATFKIFFWFTYVIIAWKDTFHLIVFFVSIHYTYLFQCLYKKSLWFVLNFISINFYSKTLLFRNNLLSID